jgi:asparagine synthase (glutamine-hydrolysing)
LRRQIRQIEPAKKGFSVNTISLWKRDKEIICQYVNNESQVVKAGIISNAWLDSARTKLDSLNVRYINKMLGLLALEVWWRLNVGRTMKKTARL